MSKRENKPKNNRIDTDDCENCDLISVIIPVFNDGTSFSTLAKQLLHNKYENLQIICVDDCSTDNSYSLLLNWAKKDSRFKILQTSKNSGAATARNKGLSAAKGKYVCFLDADDEIAPDFFTKLHSFCAEKIALVSCGIREKYLKLNREELKFCKTTPSREHNESLRNFALRNLCESGELYSSVTKIYRGDIIRKNKLRFDTSLNFGEDTKFVLDYLGCFADDFNLVFISEPLYIYNYGTSTSTINHSALDWTNWERSFVNIRNWYLDGFAHLDLNPETRANIAQPNKKLLKKLHLRFKISHALAVERSGLKFKEKKKHANVLEVVGAKLLLKIKK